MPNLTSSVEITVANVGQSGMLGAPNMPLGTTATMTWPCTKILSEDERERQSRLRFASDRNLFALTHVMLRTELSRHAEIAPQDWAFTRDANGKPALIPALMALHGLHFSLSHAGGIAVCAITRIGPVGVDVEPLQIPSDIEDLMQIALMPHEASSLNGLEAAAKHRRFLAYWTLKEAYTKACGIGLRRPMLDYGFHLDEYLPPRLVDRENNVKAWAFDNRVMIDGMISTAVCTESMPVPAFRYRYSGFCPDNEL